MLKITKINDAGWFGQQNLDVNSASEVTLSNIVDKINNKYGSSVVKKASLFKK